MSTWHLPHVDKQAVSGPSAPASSSRPSMPTPPGWQRWILPVGLIILTMSFFNVFSVASPVKTLTYSAFVTQVTEGKVKQATISNTGEITGKLASGASYRSQLPTALTDTALAPLLASRHVDVKGSAPRSNTLLSVLLSVLPFALLIGFFLWMSRRGKALGGGLSGAMRMGKSKAKVYDAERPKARFSDEAGYEGSKTEIMEVVDFLKNPDRYAKAGAVGPRGILMVGPTGPGKTLLARAVAGEARVPFFALSGSSFVEMFVGIGASRVRDLFAEARKVAPSIIFIDEIDAIGGRRGPGGFGSNDEREQTLNQLLSDMDGFEPGTDVVVLAATNRAEILDAALLRPGRFDRTVEIPLPNQVERAAILAIHGRGKQLAPDLDLAAASRGTPGFSGADLANLLNEAAINTVRAGREVVTGEDLDAARDRILIGRRDSSNALLPEEKHAVAVHESGHALVALLSPTADPVAKVTILPRGAALGVTEQLPEFERHLYPESYLKDSLAVRLGGRAAEILLLGEASTGAANDLSSATGLATRMVREWGLSTTLGPVGYGPEGPSRDNPFAGRPYAEQTQHEIDQAVTALLREAQDTATTLLTSHRDELTSIVTLLMDKETVDGDDLLTVLGPFKVSAKR